MPSRRKAKACGKGEKRARARASPASSRRVRAPTVPCGAPPPPPPVFYRRWSPRHRDRRVVLPPASQAEPVTPLVMWTVYKHPKECPGEYVARKFVITEDFYGPSNELISSRSPEGRAKRLAEPVPRLDPVEAPPRRRTAYCRGMVMTRYRDT